MKVKVESNQSHVSGDASISPWLWGGPLGAKGTVLIFRSCVLAPKEKSQHAQTPKLTKPSSAKTSTTPKPLLPKVQTKKLDTSSSTLPKNPVKVKATKNEVKAMSNVSGSHDEVNVNNYCDIKTKNGQEGTSDIKLGSTNKKEINVNNSITSIPKVIEYSTSREIVLKNERSVRKTIRSTFFTMPSIHKRKVAVVETVGDSETLSKCVPSDVSCHPLDKKFLSLDSLSGEVSSFDVANIKIPDRSEMPAALLHITYKTAMTETKLLSRMLHAHGFTDVDADSKDFNLLWSGLHPKPDVLRALLPHQRVNHFPRSYELTRKDKLFKNIEKMQYFRGAKNFDFIPLTFLMPVEYKELCTTHYRIRGPWIVKPAASSRGRGIYIVNAPDQIPKGESVVVAKYIDKPLLVDGHKCDLRLYVCVTSFDPLLIYMYEEGMVRFATVKYDKTNKCLWNPCMHLCNYSINKYHSDYIKCEDPSAENVGHKWTLSALLRHLRREGIDTAALMASIEDVVIKSIISCSQSIASASRMFVPYFNNCFELYGFDILIDETLKPWLLEINLSPSLGCDSPLDARLKASLLADTLTLVGIPAVDPVQKREPSQSPQPNKSHNLKMKIGACRRVHSAENMTSANRKGFGSGSIGSDLSLLTSDEIRIVKQVRAQYQRRGGFVRIFPSQDSWKKYAQYLDPVSGIPVCCSSTKTSTTIQSLIPHNYNLLVHSRVLPNFDQTIIANSNGSDPPERLKRYERVLPVCMRVSLESNSASRPSRNASATKNPALDSKNAKVQVKQQLQRGMCLTLEESRRAFGMFLSCVLKRISNSTSEQSAHHAELVLRFLKKTAHSLKSPYIFNSPSHKMSDKDKAAVIAKQLNDFLYIYHRETDMCTSAADDKCVANTHFGQFICGASEADLEEILLTILKNEGNVAPFLGDRLSPLCVDVPPPGKAGPPRHHLLLRYLSHVTPLHSRRFRPPTPDTQTVQPSQSADE